MKGPDFPTGGIIMGSAGIREGYETGRGRVVVRARAHTEPLKQGKTAIIVTELPYQVNKAQLIEKIADLVREKKIPEISDLRDESDRSGMRVVIELKREAMPKVVLNKLYKHTRHADHLRREHAGAGRRGAQDPLAARHAAPLHRPPEGRHHPAHPVRAGQGQEAGPHPRRAADRHHQSRRGHPDHPLERGHRSGQDGPHGALRAQRRAGPGHRRPAPAQPHRSRAAQDRRGASRPAGAHRLPRRPAGRRDPDLRRDQGGAARDQADVRRRPPHRDPPLRGRDRHRGHDRRGGDGHLHHRLRATSSGCRCRPTACSTAAASGSWAWTSKRATTSSTSSSPPPTTSCSSSPRGARSTGRRCTSCRWGAGRARGGTWPTCCRWRRARRSRRSSPPRTTPTPSTWSSPRRRASSRRPASSTTPRSSRPTASSPSTWTTTTSWSRCAHTSGHDDLILVSSEGKAIRFHEYDVRPTGRNTMGVTGMRLPDGHVGARHGGGRGRRRHLLRHQRGLRQAHAGLELPDPEAGRPRGHHHQGQPRPGRPGGGHHRPQQPRTRC